MTSYNRSIAYLAVLATGISFSMGASALAQSNTPGPQSHFEADSRAAAIRSYWTVDRMRSAKPMDLESYTPRQSTRSDEGGPMGPAGAAPGWQPGSGRQPGPNETLGGIQPRTAPPFSPPSSPTDFANYAPFQRFTWGGSLKAYPTSTIGKLFFTQNGQNFVCSASVINRSTLATAGHCVHAGNNVQSGFSTNVLFRPAFSPAGQNPTWGCWPGIGEFVSFQWFNASNSDRDYGCIITRSTGTKVANKIGNITGWTGRAWNWPSQQPIFSWGYPQGAPFAGNRLITTASTEWYQLNRNTSESQLSKYIGNDMTGGSSGGPWWLNVVSNLPEIAAVDSSAITDPAQGNTAPWINGINSHKRCTQSGCPAPSIFIDEMGSPQFLNSTTDNNDSEDVFAACFSNGGV